jgi:iron complex outermembrane receptor protein
VRGVYRDYAQGCLSFAPAVIERGGGAVLYQEWDGQGLALRGALRVDHHQVAPAGRDSNKAGRIRTRDFTGVSTALAAARPIAPNWTAAVTLLATFQPPSAEELFSEGPHLAAYAYEIGNADLEAERALGLEVDLRHAAASREARLAVFWNGFSNYIHPRDTGALEVGPGEEGLLRRYQYAGQGARMAGVEASLDVPLGAHARADGTLSWVHATLVDDGGPAPMIPPLSGRLAARFERGAWAFALVGRGAAAQRRVAAFEEPTAAWLTADVQAEWAAHGARAQAVVVTLANLTDVEYRQHLSRVKSVAPEPGRNLRILYRLFW